MGNEAGAFSWLQIVIQVVVEQLARRRLHKRRHFTGLAPGKKSGKSCRMLFRAKDKLALTAFAVMSKTAAISVEAMPSQALKYRTCRWRGGKAFIASRARVNSSFSETWRS